MEACHDCHGSGRCQHCQGRGYRGAPVARVETGSSGMGYACNYCRPVGSGICGTCHGRGTAGVEESSKTREPGRGEGQDS